ncbi:HBL/NHE enterotoxin family protein [Bacillus mycoides]|uniref:HBL/NHE enterotoxin family protein n=1 Tax=Bacillus mycoides TaxID=1405 RepID=UPI003804BB2C
MKKTILTGSLVAAIATSTLVPTNSFAEDKQIARQPKINNPLGVSSEGSGSLNDLGIQYMLMKAYALTILKQPDINLSSFPSLIDHQDIARKNAMRWLDKLNPMFISSNQEFLSSHNLFQNYYNRLYELAGGIDNNELAKKAFLHGVSIIQNNIKKNQNNLQNNLFAINTFKSSVDKNSQEFSVEVAKAIKQLEGQESKVKELTEKITSINNSITDDIRNVTASAAAGVAAITAIILGTLLFTGIIGAAAPGAATAIAGGVTALVGSGIAVGFYSDSLMKKQNKLKELTKDLSAAEIQAASLSMVKRQMDNFITNVDSQKAILYKLDSKWNDLHQDLNDLATKVNSNLNVNSAVLQTQLSQIKNSYDAMAMQAKQFEESITRVKIEEEI